MITIFVQNFRFMTLGHMRKENIARVLQIVFVLTWQYIIDHQMCAPKIRET